jgi:DNA-binding MarR family transcriptional regulator
MTNDARAFDLALFLPYLVNVLASRMSTELAQVYEESFGISIPEWRVIAHLSQNHEVSVREIFRRVDMDKAKVSRAAARLETRGLITKRANSDDRRLVRLSLTRKGRRLFEEIAPLALGYELDFLGRLSPREAATFRNLLDKLLAPPPWSGGAAGCGRARRAHQASRRRLEPVPT